MASENNCNFPRYPKIAMLSSTTEKSEQISTKKLYCQNEGNFLKAIVAEKKIQDKLKNKPPVKRKRKVKHSSFVISPKTDFNIEPIDTSLLQRYASLPRDILRERVLQLYDIAHQLSVQEEHELAKGRFLEILKM